MVLTGLSPSGVDRRDAVVVAGRTLSTSGLVAAAGSLAARIAGSAAVAVDATPSLETVVATVAGILSGVAVVPLPADAGISEARHILDDSGAEILLAGPGRSWPGGSPQARRRIEVMTVDTSATDDPAGAAGETPGDATALILYTSGTTGAPKGVPVSRRALAAGIDALAGAWDWSGEDTTVFGLPLWHVHGLVLGVLGPLRLGGRVWHTASPTPGAHAAGVHAAAAAGGSPVVFGVPTIWSRLAADPAAAALRAARLMVSGSAALPEPVWHRLAAAAGHAPIERYGMTETLITLSARAADERRAGWVGHPVAGTEVKVTCEGDGGSELAAGGSELAAGGSELAAGGSELAAGGSELAAGGEAVGELLVRGPTVMHGYLGQPDATAAVFTPDGWLRTGDIAGVDAAGWHRIVGRRDTDLIKSGGYRIGAGEVEASLLAHPAVREAAVVGAADDDLGQVVVAFVVADGVSADELITHVASTLAAHKRPRQVRMVEHLPRNAMGKVRKDLLIAGGA